MVTEVHSVCSIRCHCLPIILLAIRGQTWLTWQSFHWIQISWRWWYYRCIHRAYIVRVLITNKTEACRWSEIWLLVNEEKLTAMVLGVYIPLYDVLGHLFLTKPRLEESDVRWLRNIGLLSHHDADSAHPRRWSDTWNCKPCWTLQNKVEKPAEDTWSHLTTNNAQSSMQLHVLQIHSYCASWCSES